MLGASDLMRCARQGVDSWQRHQDRSSGDCAEAESAAGESLRLVNVEKFIGVQETSRELAEGRVTCCRVRLLFR